MIESLTMRRGIWRGHLARLLAEGFRDDWTGYLAFTGPAPSVGALPGALQASLLDDDPLTWTPEVRSPEPVVVDGGSVAVAFVTLPVVSADKDRDDALSAAIRSTREALAVRSVRVRTVARRAIESYDGALHRASAKWITEMYRDEPG